jgi:hypothetical protein
MNWLLIVLVLGTILLALGVTLGVVIQKIGHGLGMQ